MKVKKKNHPINGNLEASQKLNGKKAQNYKLEEKTMCIRYINTFRFSHVVSRTNLQS